MTHLVNHGEVEPRLEVVVAVERAGNPGLPPRVQIGARAAPWWPIGMGERSIRFDSMLIIFDVDDRRFGAH